MNNTPHTLSLEFADVNAMATAPIQNLSSATNHRVTLTDFLPVDSQSGVIAYVQAEYEAGRPPYFLLDPQSLLPITEDSPVDPDYPYGDPTVGVSTVPGVIYPTTIAAQSALVYDFPAPPGPAPRENPVYSPNLPGRWRRLTVAVAIPAR